VSLPSPSLCYPSLSVSFADAGWIADLLRFPWIYSKLIPRNTVVPTKKSQIFSTAGPSPPSIVPLPSSFDQTD
jgi:hypothetical protein